MLLRLCQLKSLFILILLLIIQVSCSFKKGKETKNVNKGVASHWFSKNLNHSLMDQGGNPVSHLLFDIPTEFDIKKREVNVVISTPQGSEHAYSIDLVTGQRHYSHTFCSQEDVWKEFKGKLKYPSFSIGYIPKVLDQLGEPQKVIVWSQRKSFFEDVLKNHHKVKLVGAYVEQICLEGNCIGKSSWLSKLVFVAIDSEDAKLQEISTLEEFKNQIDWNESQAFLANMDGQNFSQNEVYPSKRIGDLVNFEEAFEYFKKRSIFLTNSELSKIQKGCHILYDSLLTEVAADKPEDIPAKTIQELNAKIKLQKSLKEKKLPVGFSERFKKFTKKFYKTISTCEKFVYHGNINKDREAFWLLSYIGIYYRLHKEGYYFDCRSKVWQKNSLNYQGSTSFDLVRDIETCQGNSDFDKAMELLPNFLVSLKNENEFYRFTDYDNHTFGTHNKMYSWQKIKTKKFHCETDPNNEIVRKIQIFPEDTNWKKKHVNDIAEKMKIIY